MWCSISRVRPKRRVVVICEKNIFRVSNYFNRKTLTLLFSIRIFLELCPFVCAYRLYALFIAFICLHFLNLNSKFILNSERGEKFSFNLIYINFLIRFLGFFLVLLSLNCSCLGYWRYQPNDLLCSLISLQLFLVNTRTCKHTIVTNITFICMLQVHRTGWILDEIWMWQTTSTRTDKACEMLILKLNKIDKNLTCEWNTCKDWFPPSK